MFNGQCPKNIVLLRIEEQQNLNILTEHLNILTESKCVVFSTTG